LQASKYTPKSAYERITVWDKWQNSAFPLKLTSNVEKIIVKFKNDFEVIWILLCVWKR